MMKYIDEFRQKELVQALSREIHAISRKEAVFMEVCGGHTMAIQRFGIPSLLPPHIRLLSGPGCPVCVTARDYIDRAIALGRKDNVIIATFGDLIRVPGSSSSLNKEKAAGRDIRIVFSILDALNIARTNKDKKVVFLGIGFETTSPGSAAGIIRASEEGLDNFFFLSAHKVMPPAMKALVDEGVKINGYIGPGHVSTIAGTAMYDEMVKQYGLGCVVSGFEPVDLLQSVLMLVKQLEAGRPAVEIQYSRVVKAEGNIRAQEMIQKVFEAEAQWWRGFGILKDSGYRLREEYAMFDAFRQLPVEVEKTREDKGCICGEILKGLKTPGDCKLFGKACTPYDPVGACMVSNEGACAAWYRYKRTKP